MIDYKHRAYVHGQTQVEWANYRQRSGAPAGLWEDMKEYEAFIVLAMAAYQHKCFMADTEYLRRQAAEITSMAIPGYILVNSEGESVMTMKLQNDGDGLSVELRECLAETKRRIRGSASDWGLTLSAPIDALA